MSAQSMHSAMGGVMDAVTVVANDAVAGAPRWVNAQAVLVSRLADLLAARDAEWRAAVERVRESRVLEPEAMYALDALLAAMEAK